LRNFAVNFAILCGKKYAMEKLALYYSKTEKGLQCTLCPHYCTLADGETGKCQTRVCRGGQLYSLGYGNPCSVNIDPIEKKPFYHFLPQSKAFSMATAGCNFSCLNCQNSSISQVSPVNTDKYDLMPAAAVAMALKHNNQSIAYTYTEPTVFYEYMLDTATLAREKGLKNVLISNGYINEQPLRALCQLLDAANIDLKSFSNETYRKLTGGSLKPVLNSLKILKEEGVWLEITNLVIPGWTDDLKLIKEMCQWLVAEGMQDNPLHFSRFFPTYKLTDTPPTPIETLLRAREIALEAGMRYVYLGNVSGTDLDDTVCPSCKRTLVKRQGYTVTDIQVKHCRCGFCGEEIAGVWS
jgi:pyruvate formate lyase activating enzyme